MITLTLATVYYREQEIYTQKNRIYARYYKVKYLLPQATVSFQEKGIMLWHTQISSIRLPSQLKSHIEGELFPLRWLFNVGH